ncbi:hypothetical protein [Gimesia maris]|uniref:hypothetical protein n=1 Tax=Gimesia maris TaxID=122 RepID=UPI0030DB9F70|tara:strand:+ start:130142 stop:131227 length:1086 start_codon:yes stop_codon:yes gene_type:complete
MRFHKRSTTPSYFSRRDQVRLFRLVAALGVIFFAMLYASREQNWYWLTGRPADEPARQQAKEPPRAIDFSVREESPLKPDEFRSEPASEIEVPEKVIARLETGEYDVRVDPRLLNPVSDSNLGIRTHEVNALYYLLAKAAAIPQNVLEQSAEPAPPFVVVMTESPQYRGSLMTVKGHLKRLKSVPVEKNTYGVNSLYEGWFFSKDSGTHPWRVFCTQLPAGIPKGEDLAEMPEVQITGYYFKKSGYLSAAGKLQTAPLLIARQIRWFPPTNQPAPSSSGAVKYIVSLFLVISITLVFLIWRFMVSDQKFARSRTAKLMQRPDMSMDSLKDIETVDINDVLKQMGQQKQDPPAGSDQPDEQK